MTIVVVEGVDGAGKSTLIRSLRRVSKQYYWTLNASGPPNTSAEVERAVDELSSLIDGSPTNWVFDRHPLISEPIYGEILRGKNELQDVSTALLHQYLLQFTRIIYCRPPEPVIFAGAKVEAQLPGVHDRLQRLIDSYDELMLRLRVQLDIEVIEYDWTRPSPNLNDLFWGRV